MERIMWTRNNGSNLYISKSCTSKSSLLSAECWCPSCLLLHLFVVTSQNATPYIESKFSISLSSPTQPELLTPQPDHWTMSFYKLLPLYLRYVWTLSWHRLCLSRGFPTKSLACYFLVPNSSSTPHP
jgi:hypothetical protein